MNGLRKIFGVLMAVMLTAFALPAAAQKVYTINLSPASLTAGVSGQALSATMNNISPDQGNSTVKSFKLVAPVGGGITISGPASGNSVPLGGGYTATIQNNGTSIFVSHIQQPLKPFGAALVLNMTVDVSCTATGAAWTVPGVWNGSGFTGQTFFQSPPTFLTPTINPGCVNFTFTTTPNPSLVNSPSGTVTAVFTNTSAAAVLQSAQVTAPTGLTITGGTASNGGTVTVLGQVVTVQGGTAVAAGNSLTLTLTEETTGSCTVVPLGAWSNAQASSGGTPTSSTQLVFQGSYPTTSVNAQACSLSFVDPPTSVAQSPATFSLTVRVTGGSGSPSVTIAATGASCPALSGTLTKNAPVGSDTTFSGLSFAGIGTCTVTASATNYNNSNATLTSFKVYDGILACNLTAIPTFPPTPGPGYFANLPLGVSGVSDPGFAAGYRVKNDKNPEECPLVNYTFTNNIKGSGNTTDGAGNTIPPNSAALVWDLDFQPNAVYVYVLTFRPEYVGGNGLPVMRTKFCILGTGATDCTIPANQQNLQACIGTAYSSTSIPGSDPACIIEETWTTVPVADCASLVNPNAPAAPPACVKGTNKLLDARDPPIIRG